LKRIAIQSSYNASGELLTKSDEKDIKTNPVKNAYKKLENLLYV
jgi:hypothetical protein